ncbi:MAG: VanZ family protein [Planctomycetes bacterium]|nr:VanZ family protein [Planctomycetota bacterium]
MSESVAPERGFRAALRWLGQGLLSLPTTAALALVLGWSYLMYWAVTLPSEELEGVYYLKSFVNDLGHAPLFGLWILWMLPLLPRRGDWVVLGSKAWLALITLALLGGAGTEYLQGSIPGRTASWADVLTDVVGAASVLWVASYLGTPDATEEGTRSRLTRGLLACCASALLATFTV